MIPPKNLSRRPRRVPLPSSRLGFLVSFSGTSATIGMDSDRESRGGNADRIAAAPGPTNARWRGLTSKGKIECLIVLASTQARSSQLETGAGLLSKLPAIALSSRRDTACLSSRLLCPFPTPRSAHTKICSGRLEESAKCRRNASSPTPSAISRYSVRRKTRYSRTKQRTMRR